MKNLNKPLICIFAAISIYTGGVLFSHLEYSAADRQACYAAGGFVGRISCPDTVDIDGFKVHFVKALGWPAGVAGSMVSTVGDFEKAVVAYRSGGEAQ